MNHLRPYQRQACDAMKSHHHGQIIMPTGAGKTTCMVKDCIDRFASLGDTPGKHIVVAPRILLAQQLCEDFIENEVNAAVLHVHSGQTNHMSTTNANYIRRWSNQAYHHQIFFTTYHSLKKLREAGIHADTIYFDEAHHSIKRNFFHSTEHFAADSSDRCYFFTATPTHSNVAHLPGMNDTEIYGNVLYRIVTKKLIDSGYILPPELSVSSFSKVKKNDLNYEIEAENLVKTIDNDGKSKVLVCARSTKQMMGMLYGTNLRQELKSRGFDWCSITSKHGAIINDVNVSRDQFFEVLKEWGESDRRFIILHYNILTEGINIPSLESVIFLRSPNVTAATQSIGRVLRIDSHGVNLKNVGTVSIPAYDTVGINTTRNLSAVIDSIHKGQHFTRTIGKK